MEDKIIKKVKNWPKLKLIKNIPMFLKFANFYGHFIWNFSKIAALFTLILKITEISDSWAPIVIEININKIDNGDLKPNFSKSKKINLTESKILGN